MLKFVKDNWFMLGLIAIPLLTVADSPNLTVDSGIWLKSNNGPDCVIILIFLFSGMALNTKQLKDGIADIRGTLLALALIFVVAPVLAYLLSHIPLQTGIILGLLLVSAMPTTLSSGVVMTGRAGGNMAHALLITIIANSLAVFSIPVTLQILLGSSSGDSVVEIDQFAIMIKLATRVLLPLLLGIVLRNGLPHIVPPLLPYTSKGNQIGILVMVWMAVCAGREAIVSSLDSIAVVVVIVFLYHSLLVAAAFATTSVLKVKKHNRESIIFMGGQKTLPLSVILQVSLFPGYGIALVVCVIHHIIHLIMDAYLINYLKNRA